MTVYRFGSIKACFDVIEEILKLSSDTSSEIEQDYGRILQFIY
jgi:hypothetical protein